MIALVVLMEVLMGMVTATSTNFTVTGFIEGITCDSTGTYLTLAEFSGTGQIFFSSNGGSVWAASNAPGVGYNAIGANPVQNQYVVAVGTDNSVVLSSNFGQSWSTSSSNVPGSTFAIDAVAVANGYSTVIAMSTSTAANGQCVYISSNGGSTWSSALGPSLAGAVCNTVAANGDASQIVLSLSQSNGLYLSTNLGSSWTQVYSTSSTSATLNIYSIVYNSHLSVFYATVAGQETNPVLKSNVGATLWSAITGTWAHPIVIDPTGIAVSYDGQYIMINDDGNIQFSADGGLSYYKALVPPNAGGLACMATEDVSPPPFYMFVTSKTVYTTTTLPTPSPTRAPSLSPSDAPSSSSSGSLCDSSVCPTSCPYGFSKSYENSFTGCVVYCKSQPTNGQCSSTGSGCESSCRTAGELAGIIIGVVVGVALIVAIIYFVVRRCCCQPPPSTATVNLTSEMQSVQNPIASGKDNAAISKAV
eukprot:gene16281-11641_t